MVSAAVASVRPAPWPAGMNGTFAPPAPWPVHYARISAVPEVAPSMTWMALSMTPEVIHMASRKLSANPPTPPSWYQRTAFE